MKKVILSIDGMTCSACSNGLEKYLNKQDGIKTASVNLVMNNASIEYDSSKLSLEDLDKFVEKAGFKSLGIDTFEKEQRKNSNEKYRLIAQSVFSILILYVSMSHMVGLPVIPYLNMINYPLKMLNLYWNIGKTIIEIQKGDERATYGDAVLDKLSQKLTNEFGKGFSSRNLRTMRKFYLMYPIWKTVSAKLSWSHYLELIKIDEEPKRNFYLNECINSRWSVRELERQIGSLLYERLVLSANKQKVLELAEKGHELKTSKDLVKDPFVLEFLDIKENTEYLESDLEKNILEHLKEFLLELGKGFMFVGSQVRLTLEEDHFYPDLVFYNRLLKCFVIIDLKIGKVTHQDIGQMQMYVNYYDREIKKDDENPTVGILLSTLKNKTVVKYTLPEDNKNIFSSQYKLHLPTEKELIDAIEEEKTNLRLNNDDNKI